MMAQILLHPEKAKVSKIFTTITYQQEQNTKQKRGIQPKHNCNKLKSTLYTEKSVRIASYHIITKHITNNKKM
jgi:hypothetical protein